MNKKFFSVYMNSININIIGEGWFGIVLMPPLQCKENINIPPNSVAKISHYKDLKREYDFMNEYIKYSPSFSQLVNNSDIILCEFNYDNLPEKILTLLEDRENPTFELIMPYLGKTFDKYIDEYKNKCQETGDEVISVAIFINYMNAIYRLLDEIKLLNYKGIYHNDIKPNNLIYNEEVNSLLLIDFGLSISKKLPQYYAPEIKITHEFSDIHDLFVNVLLKVLLLGFSNKYIYDKFIQIYTVIQNYLVLDFHKINSMLGEISPKDIINVKNQLINFMDNIMLLINDMDPLQPIEENTDTTYCDIKKNIKVPIKIQRENAYIRFKQDEMKKQEQQTMFKDDIRHGGKKRTKTLKNYKKGCKKSCKKSYKKSCKKRCKKSCKKRCKKSCFLSK
jgi:serine/threonine protein kinase